MMHWWWWDYGAPMPWYGAVLGPFMMLIVIGLIVLAVAYLLRTFGRNSATAAEPISPLDILKERFARGEIDRAEYESRKQALSNS
jgi:putative membrane protein